eukprot:13135124-Ditylum_brightwellii.AAC.1
MTHAGLTTTSNIKDLPTTDNVMTNSKLESLAETVSRLDKLVPHVSDMLGSVKSQSGAENLVVELGGDIFKGEAD